MRPNHLLRRKFLAAAGVTGGMLALRTRSLHADQPSLDPQVAEVLKSTIGIDMHNHVYPAGTEPKRQWGPRPGGQGGPGNREGQGSGEQERRDQGDGGQGQPLKDAFGALPFGDELKKTGLTAVCASFVLDFAKNEKPGDARNNYLAWLTAIDAELDKAHLHRALNINDLKNAHKEGRPTIIQTVEGSHFIEGDLSRIEEVYKRGLRHLQLLHDMDDAVKPLGDINTAQAHLGGLTEFGAEVIKECNRLGIVIDLAHASHETVAPALKVSSQPVIISHTCLIDRAELTPNMGRFMKPRLISKENAKVVADAGGIIGVWKHMTNSVSDYVNSVKQMVDAIGADHVGIGTDTDLLSTRQGQSTNTLYPDMTQGFFPSIVAELLKQGFKPEDISKIGGGNFCRVFEQVTSSHA